MARDREKQREAWQRWYKKNSAKHIARVRASELKRDAEIRLWMSEVKSQRTCEVCGFENPVALDFHHKDPSQKEFNVGDAIKIGAGRERIEKEMDKCSVLCKNCHAIHHSVR